MQTPYAGEGGILLHKFGKFMIKHQAIPQIKRKKKRK
jgi:hypothetical protein